MLDGFVVGCPLGCDFAPPSFPKFRFRCLHATAATNRHRDRRGHRPAASSRSSWPTKLANGPERIRTDCPVVKPLLKCQICFVGVLDQSFDDALWHRNRMIFGAEWR